MTTSPIKLHKITSASLLSLLSNIETKIFSLLEFDELYDIDYKKSKFEAILLVLAIKIYQEKNESSSNEIYDTILTELPNATSKKIIKSLKDEGIDISDFILNRLSFYSIEYEALIKSNALENYEPKVMSIAYKILASPLDSNDYVYIEDLQEFGHFMNRNGYSEQFFKNIIDISNHLLKNDSENIENLINSFTSKYVLEFGQNKFQNVVKNLLNSNSFKNFLLKFQDSNNAPTTEEIISTVMNILYFGFGKKTTVAIGSIILLQVWNDEINKRKFLIDNNKLTELFNQIIKKTSGLI